MKVETTGDYHVTCLSRHPLDNYLCDGNARWWPLQYEYILVDNNIHFYGSRILLDLNREPNLKKYIHWIDSVHLIDTSCFIHGSFNFDSRSDVIKSKQYVALSHW